MAASYCFCWANSIPFCICPALAAGGLQKPVLAAVNQRSDAIAMMIVGLFKIFISPSSLFFERFIGCKRAKLTHEKKQSDAENGFNPRYCQSTGSHKSLRRLRGSLRHDRYLVDAIALSILPKSLLRSVGTEFLPLSCRLPRDRAITDLPHPTRCPTAQLARSDDLLHSLFA